MVRGLYTAGTGMMLQRRKMEVITSNMTNADTTGFQKDYVVAQSFDDVLLRRINDTSVIGVTPELRSPGVGPLNFGTRVEQVYINMEQGNLEPTDELTDLALIGENNFFVVQTEAGERYSRAGAFYRDVNGYLTDADGNYVLGSNGPVYVGSGDFSVDQLGAVNADGNYTGTIRVVSFADPLDARKQGDNLYYSAGAEPQASQNYAIRQSCLENSNVEVAREMVDMMTTYRVYETNQKMLTMIDETIGKAVNEIGRLR